MKASAAKSNQPFLEPDASKGTALTSRPFLTTQQPGSPEVVEEIVTQKKILPSSDSRFIADSSPSDISTPFPPLQRKLAIGEPGDKYEQEADKVAAKVVEQINQPQIKRLKPSSPNSQLGDDPVQHQNTPIFPRLEWSSHNNNNPSSDIKLDTQNILQRKMAVDVEGDRHRPVFNRRDGENLPYAGDLLLRRFKEKAIAQSTGGKSIQGQEGREEKLQSKPLIMRREAIAGESASTDLDSAINSAVGNGQPLDTKLQQSIGQIIGADFSRVRIHADSQSDRLSQSIQAKAFTTGQDIFFRQGAYNPGTKGGQELLVHELIHVVQQNRTSGSGGSDRGGKVQRKVTENKLNVIGEDHDQSKKREKDEKRYITEKTGSSNYWSEGSFFVDQEGKKQSGDSLYLRELQLVSLGRQLIIDGTNSIMKTNPTSIKREYPTPDEIKVETLKDSLSPVCKKMKSYASWSPPSSSDDKSEKEGKAVRAALKETAKNISEAITAMETAETEKDIDDAKGNLFKIIKIREEVHRKQENEILLPKAKEYNIKIEEIGIKSLYKTKEFSAVSKARSKHMVDQLSKATSLPDGAWKVGYSHADDMEKDEDMAKIEKVALTSQKDFDDEMKEWEKTWKAISESYSDIQNSVGASELVKRYNKMIQNPSSATKKNSWSKWLKDAGIFRLDDTYIEDVDDWSI